MTTKFYKRLAGWGRRLVDWLYPAVCPVCGQALAEGERTICLACRWDMPLTDYWMADENPLLRMLRSRLPNLRHASALLFFRHESGYRAMIHALKYSGRRDIAVALGEMFGRELRESALYDDIDLLIPVPLHWTKRLRRGYNQAEEICIGLSRGLGVPYDFRSLRRIRRTRTQALHRDADARRLNVEGAFCLRRSERFQDRHILLVDDVLTTGATVTACAEAIYRVFPEARISIAALATVRKHLKKR
ncbi:MAG: double zinc ribbon domain-containing protein [Rikenella sp.]|nr:double zinc ribbon domain-containing protein [Rikenella sp.]